jgi:DNA topoisomerase-1
LPDTDPREAARSVRLRYVRDDAPGISRRGAGTGFSYHRDDGSRVDDVETLERIRKLAIPPAWQQVWICAHPNGHLQATGRDARGRKQYRYHTRWREVRDADKYDRMVDFGRALPTIRERVDADLRLSGIPRERALAAVVQLLEQSLIRIGNEAYARDNGSYGLTTLRSRHVEVGSTALRFRFVGKSGKRHTVTLRNRRLAALVRRMRELPGQVLFKYLDDDGETVAITSADVNEYLQESSGSEFTAKDFRTWAGTLNAASQLPAELDDCDLNEVVRNVAERLGNTVAVCRKCYIHPAVIAAFTDADELARWHEVRSGRRDGKWLERDEAALIEFLDAIGRGKAG